MQVYNLFLHVKCYSSLNKCIPQPLVEKQFVVRSHNKRESITTPKDVEHKVGFLQTLYLQGHILQRQRTGELSLVGRAEVLYLNENDAVG